MAKYELTVVTTTYNQEKYIKRCVESILSQKTNFQYQLIVSNDNSTDKTQKILEQLAEKYPAKLRVINRKHNLGPMNNFVETLNEVHTKYVALCDGDDYWTDENKLQKQYDFLEDNLNYNICFHQTLISFENEEKDSVFHPLKIDETLTIDNLVKENFIPANTVMYRWKYLDKDSLRNDFPKNIVPGDYYLHLIHAKDGKIKYIDQTMSVYRRQKRGMWYLTTQPEKQDKFFYLYGKRYYNFYKQTELKIDRPNVFKIPREWILKNYIKVIIKKKKIKLLLDILKTEYKDNFNIISLALNECNKIDKFFYFLVKKYYVFSEKGEVI